MRLDRASTALGWASIGIGVTELVAPRWLGKQLGIGEQTELMRALGAREIATGVAVLATPDPAPGLWARVAGDLVDLALLGAAAAKSERRKAVAVAAAGVLAIASLDLLSARHNSRGSLGPVGA